MLVLSFLTSTLIGHVQKQNFYFNWSSTSSLVQLTLSAQFMISVMHIVWGQNLLSRGMSPNRNVIFGWVDFREDGKK